MDITVYTFEDFEDELEFFLKNYDGEVPAICPNEKIKHLKAKEDRVCRFCGLKQPQTTFRKEPHVISEHLGNKYLVSDFECDKCNEFFGKYENDLAYFLGASRTVLQVKNKENKVPTFKSPGNLLVARRAEFNGIKEGIKISREESAKGIFNIDVNSGKIEIKYQKHPYTPIKVYKALLKIALSIIPENYVKDYQEAYYYLFNSAEGLKDLERIFYCKLPDNHQTANPYCLLFKKIEPRNNITNHFFALYFQKFIFAFPVPLCKVDIENNLYNGEKFRFPLFPPILFSRPAPDAKYFRTIIDLSSNEKVSEKACMTILHNSNILNNLKAYDNLTGEVADKTFNPDDITEIYFAPYDPNGSFPKS